MEMYGRFAGPEKAGCNNKFHAMIVKYRKTRNLPPVNQSLRYITLIAFLTNHDQKSH